MNVNKKAKYVDINGILLVDKPQDASSNHVLQRVRRGYNARKAGHTGTLDPFASGLLVCCFGQATKISGQLLDADKTYRASLQLGMATDTADGTGQACARAAVPALQESEILAVLAAMTGEREQVPPMYSALKINGRRLYELARAGMEVERRPRRIVIHRLQLHSWAPRQVTFTVQCSKGTYVRTLGEEIAMALGTVGHLTALRRLALGPFQVEQAHTPDQLEAAGWPAAALLGSDRALSHWPACTLDGEQMVHFLHGRQARPAAEGGPAGENIRVYGEDGVFLGCACRLADGAIQPKRLFVAADKG